MNFPHFLHRRRLGLLAAGVLDSPEKARVAEHAAACASCRTELTALETVSALLQADAAIDRSLPISSEALQTRVFARLRSNPKPAPTAPAFGFAAALSAAALVGLGMLAGILATRLMTPAERPAGHVASGGAPGLERFADTAINDAAFYERLEKTQLRANAARYLTDAQDILVQVRAAADCPDSPRDSVDVTREAQTSRRLLRRRAALVSGSGETLLAARGVMEEVEGMLQQVAELPQCTKRSDVDAIARRVESRNLLMKIDMVAQELAAP